MEGSQGQALSVPRLPIPTKVNSGNQEFDLETVSSSTTRQTFYHWYLETASDKKARVTWLLPRNQEMLS